jgi:hypothetical protein
MVCEEADVSAVYAEPRSEAYEEMREIALAGGRRARSGLRGRRRAHTWAKEAGFELVHVDAYHPHYLHRRPQGLLELDAAQRRPRPRDGRALSMTKLDELVAGMTRPTSRPTPSWRTAACTRSLRRNLSALGSRL